MCRISGGRCWALATVLVLAACTGRGAASQSPLSDVVPRVAEVVITGELDPFSRDELEELLRTRPNRTFLGIPGVTPSLWLYELGTPRTALGRAFQRAGEPPALYDPELVEADRMRLQVLFRQAGFLSAQVASDAQPIGGELVRVVFGIARGPASIVRTVGFDGLEKLSREERLWIIQRSLLHLGVEEDAAVHARPVVPAAAGQRLAEAQLLEERRRLLADLREIGFAQITRDSIRALAQPVDTLPGRQPVFDVSLEIRTGQRFTFGDVQFRVMGPEDAPTRTDSVVVGDGVATAEITGDRRLSPELLYRALRFEPGDVYRQSQLLETKRRLDGTGAFTFSEISPLPAMTEQPIAGDALPRLPHRIVLRTRPRHSVRLEGFVLQRTGVLGEEAPDGELGFGAGASYRNANAFGGGEQFNVGLNASVAGDLPEFPTAQAEFNAGLRMPYLMWPFGALERWMEPYDVRTRISTGFLVARREELRLLIRGRASAGVRLEIHHSPTVASLVDVLDFQLSDPDTLAGFRRQFLDLIEDPVAREFVIQDYTQPQINNALRYTLRAGTADPFRRDRGYATEAAIEVGGNLPYLLDRFVFSPGVIEGAIPGLPLFGGGAGLEYRPYARAAVDARRYLRLNRLSVLALKAMAGAAHPTAHAPVVPFDRRFYIGGVGSVRGWELRQLGPGRIPPEESAFVQGGEIKLEAGAELRRVIIRNLFAADWQLAAFADAGNIWFGPRNPGDPDGRFRLSTFHEEIAVGAGTGVRVAWEFLILRFDLAWKVRSPVPDDPLFPDGNRPRLHFGIGQAF
jgi:outer membrane protein insertion porin family